VTGNRRPCDASRVELRKRTRDMFTDPSKMNVATLLPHEIAYSAYTSTSRAKIDYNNAAFDKKAMDMEADFERIRAEMADAAAGDADAVAAAMSSGRILGVADVSGSMMTTAGGESPNTPLDIAVGLVAFIARIAAKPYRGLAMSFTDVPTIYDLKVGDRPMTAKESITAMMKHVGYNTNYQGMHKALIKLCVDNSVPESELPVLYIASDCNFDQMDPSINSFNPYNYNYNTQCHTIPPGTKTSAQRWESTHKTIMGMWVKAGYKKVPLMVYHNIHMAQSGVQATQDFKGVILLTGRSEQVIKLVLYGEAAGEVEQEIDVDGVSTTVKVQNVTPYDTFRKAMELDHFALLERVLLGASEGAMKYITPDTIGGYTATIAA